MSSIGENPSVAELQYQIDQAKTLLSNKTLVKQMGITPLQRMKIQTDIKRFEQTMKELIELPDSFNTFLGPYGWSAYESLSIELVKEVVSKVKESGVEAGEEVLISYFQDREKINHFLVKASRRLGVRGKLFEHAYQDHFEHRFYSSVPLFLMIIDGFVNDIEQTGFFAENTNLLAWDSLAGHSTGLGKVSEVFSKSRKKTNDEVINIPYRNGILHGRDVNYDNAFNSSKLLSTIFALIDWQAAKEKMKQGKTKEKFIEPNEEEITAQIIATTETIIDNAIQKELISKWEKREIEVGSEIPESGEINDYQLGTPERTMVEIIHFIKDQNYGHLADRIYFDLNRISKAKKCGDLKEKYGKYNLTKFKLVEVEDISIVITVLTMEITFLNNEKEYSNIYKFRMIYSDEFQEALIKGHEKGSWRLMENFEYEWETDLIKNLL